MLAAILSIMLLVLYFFVKLCEIYPSFRKPFVFGLGFFLFLNKLLKKNVIAAGGGNLFLCFGNESWTDARLAGIRLFYETDFGWII